jgi:hypothetical protein
MAEQEERKGQQNVQMAQDDYGDAEEVKKGLYEYRQMKESVKPEK